MKKKIIISLFLAICLVGCGKNDSFNESVKNYLEKSKKAAYADIIISYMDDAMKEVNSKNKLELDETNTLYLIPGGNDEYLSCLFPELFTDLPYSNKWNYLYIGITYNGKTPKINNYNYYSISEDGASHGLDFFDKKTIGEDGMNYIYTDSKINKSGYDILYKQYNRMANNSIYEENGLNSNDYLKLSSILKTNESYNKIIIIGSKECSYEK